MKEKLVRKVYYLYPGDIKKVDKYAKQKGVSGSIVIRRQISKLIFEKELKLGK